MPPTIAVVFDFGSATAIELCVAADGVCDIVFVCDPMSSYVAETLPMLRSFGTVVTTVDGIDDVVAQLREIGVEGVATFGDAQLVTAAEIGAALELPFHSVATARMLTDKDAQRRRLAERGVAPVRFAAVSSAAALQDVGVPAVLKPRRGAGSRNTVLVSDDDGYAAAVAAAVASGDTDLILEEQLIGDPTVAGEAWGDYVSVESLVQGPEIVHLGVTGKPRLAEPFRETGAFFPSTVSEEVRSHVEKITEQALRALDIRAGLCHTELKFTSSGPRLIEVNARLGGYLNDVYARSAGVELLRLALRAALGVVRDVSPAQPHQVAYQFFVAPPVWARVVERIDGLEDVRALRGVQSVDVWHPVGAALDWRRGTASAVAVVRGTAADHGALAETIRAVGTSLTVTYGPAQTAARIRP